MRGLRYNTALVTDHLRLTVLL